MTAQRRRTGRPTKLTPEVQRHMELALSAGATIECACAFAGITRNTYWRWMKWGEQERGPEWVAFSIAVKKALAAVEMRLLAIITAAGRAGQWQASAWFLERRFPEKFGRRWVSMPAKRERPPRIVAARSRNTTGGEE